MHYSVLLNEAIEGLNLKKDSIVIDATLGYAGHSSSILKRIPKGHLYAFDLDNEAINYSSQELKKISSNFTLIHDNYKNMPTLDIKVDAILFDLGVSSPEIDQQERGFSFMKDALLDMRMNQESFFKASNVVNEYSLEKLEDLFFRYGEEPLSKKIAQMIVKKRPINKTLELTKIIEEAVGSKYYNQKHPERRIFQAIRIEVNDELNSLKEVLPQAINMLKPNGRLAVITFHSLEDRIVKQIFKQESEVAKCWLGEPNIPKEYLPKIKLINKKPILATDKELNENTRSKSAKLRIIERI